ncbi:MAG: MarR family transcriptional regulator [Acidimicrobiia bacterium]|nr:MarR family transcriptional regulator [Acidimicrobiia bacterium]MDH4305992.1 MarR family transcriptional regulator [Acidimicrobiia bacterium]MDH5292879.1 MarR family transcriptional regulator [Acidimicrobiia bacterium]
MVVRLDDHEGLLEAERDIVAKLGDDRRFDFSSLQAISNIYRAANAIRNFMEREVLGGHGLSWGGFTALFVLWVWGPHESHALAEECGMAKGTLTGVVATLEKRGLVTRTRLSSDRRRVEVDLTEAGRDMIESVFPVFHLHEVALTSPLSTEDRLEMARLLRSIIGAAG